MIASLVAKFRPAMREAERPAVDAFRALALAVARGEEPTPDHVAAVLHATERGLEELHAEAERLAKRLKARERLTAAATAERELPGVEAELRAVNEREAAAVAEARRERAAILERRQRLTTAIARGPEARGALQGSIADDLRQRLAEAAEHLRPLRERAAELRDELRGMRAGSIGYVVKHLTAEVERAREAVQRVPGPAKRQAEASARESEERLAAAQRDCERREALLAELELQIADATRDLDNLHAEALQV